VTIRLWDSMPQTCRGQWEALLRIEDERERRTKLEEYLDRGLGDCLLHNSQVARLVENALLNFHGSRYELFAWCVMPNHVHVLVQVWRMPLWKMVQSWKRFIATSAQTVLTEHQPPARPKGNCSPQFDKMFAIRERPAFRVQRLRWQREYWDTFMRDEK